MEHRRINGHLNIWRLCVAVAGTLALQQGDPEEATRQFTLAVVANPAHPTGYCYRAECRVALGHYAEAIKDFQKATELAPQLVRLKLG